MGGEVLVVGDVTTAAAAGWVRPPPVAGVITGSHPPPQRLSVRRDDTIAEVATFTGRQPRGTAPGCLVRSETCLDIGHAEIDMSQDFISYRPLLVTLTDT